MTREYESVTTLKRIRKAQPCLDGWGKLLTTLGKSRADDVPLDLVTVLDSNGFNDALWVLSYAMPDDRLARHFQAWCVEQFLHIFEAEYPNDTRVRDQIAMLRRDDATSEERFAARFAAWAAAKSAARSAAKSAARSVAWAAAEDVAWQAANRAERVKARGAQERQLRKMLGMRKGELA